MNEVSNIKESIVKLINNGKPNRPLDLILEVTTDFGTEPYAAEAGGIVALELDENRILHVELYVKPVDNVQINGSIKVKHTRNFGAFNFGDVPHTIEVTVVDKTKTPKKVKAKGRTGGVAINKFNKPVKSSNH